MRLDCHRAARAGSSTSEGEPGAECGEMAGSTQVGHAWQAWWGEPGPGTATRRGQESHMGGGGWQSASAGPMARHQHHSRRHSSGRGQTVEAQLESSPHRKEGGSALGLSTAWSLSLVS